nr:MAG TPA: hypothetical protein [Caudoviricetes sp.]
MIHFTHLTHFFQLSKKRRLINTYYKDVIRGLSPHVLTFFSIGGKIKMEIIFPPILLRE